MDDVNSMLSDMWGWLSAPFRQTLPAKQLALVCVVWVILAIVLYDSVRILSAWMEDHAANLVEV